jgi:hypothetical protein
MNGIIHIRNWVRTNGEMSEDGKSITYNCKELEGVIAEGLRIHDVVGRSEQLLALAKYMCQHQNNLDGKTAKDYLQDFLSQ